MLLEFSAEGEVLGRAGLQRDAGGADEPAERGELLLEQVEIEQPHALSQDVRACHRQEEHEASLAVRSQRGQGRIRHEVFLQAELHTLAIYHSQEVSHKENHGPDNHQEGNETAGGRGELVLAFVAEELRHRE